MAYARVVYRRFSFSDRSRAFYRHRDSLCSTVPLLALSLSLSLSLLASSGIAADFSDVRRGRFGDLRICEGIIVLISGGLSGGYQLSRA